MFSCIIRKLQFLENEYFCYFIENIKSKVFKKY